MKITCFLNNKGGVGKTASVTTIAHILATEFNQRVLVVDLDPQHNTSSRFSDHNWFQIFNSIMLGNRITKEEYTVEDILLDVNFDPHLAIKKTEYENLSIIPSYLTLAQCEEAMKADVKMPQQFKLKRQLAKLDNEYDICLIDCSPSISMLNINALTASKEVYFPLRTDGDSCVGFAISYDLVRTVQDYNPDLKIGGAFLTQCVWNEGASKITYELLKNVIGDKLIPIQIGTSTLLKRNSYEQKPLLEIDSGKMKSNVTLAYIELSKYILADDKKEYLITHEDDISKLKHMKDEE